MGGVSWRRAVLVCMAGLLGSSIACRKNPAGDGPYASEVADAVPRIEQATGLRFKSQPKVEVRTKEQVRDFLLNQFDEATPAAELKGEESAYKLFGMIPDSMDLRKFLIAVLSEQVVGYYDPATKVLYVVQGADEKLAGITITHELVHALQDQYVNLDSIQHATSDNDRLSAAQAVIEGQAQYEQLSIMLGGSENIALQIGGRDRIRDLIRENQSAMPVFATAPMVIQESLLFPYLAGADFVQRFEQQRGKANPLEHLPVSTEQILHTDAYFGTPPDEPSIVSLPAPHGATATYENDLGEFGARLLLYQFLKDQDLAARAASGWDADRYVVLENAGGRGIVWVSVWDSALQAATFTDALTRATSGRTGAIERSVGSGGARFAIRGRTTSITPETIGGRPVVIYSDLPDGMSAGVIDAGAIKVTSR
jgi:hypothetical protein